ncbi:hypothetical protein, variant [Verruconis gallopava]|uniref:F-box domain-containing protein n=1 Tax=Verruconis gallopava TaxID=253628 RepID=A0A0D2AGM3_9PEZI|nr:hypothetical protein, variant [Verruconis gallopava]KIW06053.1 hypothetical protein, variant [Verruconis gallopava]
MGVTYHNLYGGPTKAPSSATSSSFAVADAAHGPRSHETTGPCHLYSLPNELILHVLSQFSTSQLLPLAGVSHRMHALVARLFHARLLQATRFPQGGLILECYPPSQKLTAPALDCAYTGTPGIEGCLDDDAASAVGKLAALRDVYSRFRPRRRESRRFGTTVPGDIPGSRTHAASANLGAESAHARRQAQREEDKVKQILSLEGHERFIQLEGNLHLVRRLGFVQNLVAVHEGYVRIWRDWLGQRATADAIAQLGEGDVVELPELDGSSCCAGPVSVDGTSSEDLREHEGILWLERTKNVGLRVKVQEKKWRRHMPILVHADDEVAVSYEVVYEELFVRTAHLVLTLERSAQQEDMNSGKVVVFGSFR